ncbi:hypothetical protein Hypma_008509 [Hypsizygus marmoreus]|uniref:Uncharacterized protein n=1 Tax=Hypsizygus marmoreus TaxID=39966 RepID=A0A369JVJ0_HYPMA|nr:hypothetical protein Hypma_008509 [Hypsizygus marmoreus]
MRIKEVVELICVLRTILNYGVSCKARRPDEGAMQNEVKGDRAESIISKYLMERQVTWPLRRTRPGAPTVLSFKTNAHVVGIFSPAQLEKYSSIGGEEATSIAVDHSVPSAHAHDGISFLRPDVLDWTCMDTYCALGPVANKSLLTAKAEGLEKGESFKRWEEQRCFFSWSHFHFSTPPVSSLHQTQNTLDDQK